MISDRSFGRRAVAWLGWWAAMFALYLALVDTRQLPELVLGAVVATVGAAATVTIRTARPLPPLPAAMVARAIPRALARLVVETGTVLAVIARLLRGARPRGHLRAVPFRSGGDGGPDVARRALTESLGSMGPNQIVLGIDRDRDLLVVHQLVADDERADPLELG